MNPRYMRRVLALLAGLLIAEVSLAQPVPSTEPTFTPKYGTTNLTYVRVTGIEFVPQSSGIGYGGLGFLGRYPTSGGDVLVAPVHLPSGSIIDYLEIVFCDYLDPQDIILRLYDCGALGGRSLTPQQVANVNSFGNPGCSAISTSGFHYQVNPGGSFALRAFFQANDVDLAITSAIVGYRLQVSPAPGAATFGDVPINHPYFQFIEALAASGITAGCNAAPPLYCPDREITRGEMAVFLAKALGLHFPN
jgi:hypothetical protein